MSDNELTEEKEMKKYLAFLIGSLVLCLLIVSCGSPKMPQSSNSPENSAAGQPPRAEAAARGNATKDAGHMILGFYTDSRGAKDSMLKQLNLLDEVDFFWYTFDGKGAVKRAGRVDLNLKDTVQKKGTKALALVNNLSGSGFDSQLAHQVLANMSARKQFIKNLADLTAKENWDGISIDIEKVPAHDRSNYSAFLTELHTALAAKNKILSVSIPAKYHDDPNDLWSGAFDYPSIGKAADQVVIMTYEEHGIGTTQGPIASFGWVNRVINYSTGQIPKDKLYMGLPVYANDWGSDKPLAPRAFSSAQVEKLAKSMKVNIQFDPTEQVPHFAYTHNGVRHEVYFEDERSLKAKLGLAVKNNLKGVAVWKLGIEDSSLWTNVLKNYK